ncbi:MAG: hypothetical protein MUE69_16225 [Myxococcota bacterium]|jgi:hypothetical protein|nr:hypothetical protein [Myxococcota bacterium]
MLSRVALRRELVASLDRLLGRGRRHARAQRLGCAITSAGMIVATLLLALGHFQAMALVGVVTLGAYWVASLLDPELADDRRVRLVRELLERLPLDEKAPVTLELELTDYEVETPIEKKPAGSGRLDARYVQRWLKLGFLATDGTRVTLELEVDARLAHDGIAIASRVERERATLRFEVDGFPVRREVADVETWVREGERFAVEGLATADEVLRLVDAALGESV